MYNRHICWTGWRVSPMTAAKPLWTEDDYENEDEMTTVRVAEPVEEVKIEAKDVYREAEIAAKRHIDSFFADKQMHCGGAIPKRLLHDPKRVRRVVNYNISKGIRRCYHFLKNTITEEEKLAAKKTGDSTRDIKLVNETLNLLARSCVPQQFAGGILCMYLEFVEGVDFSK